MKGRREKGRSVPSVTISERKEGKKKEPVTSVTILMQPMAVAYMKLDNHAGSKGRPLLIYRIILSLTGNNQLVEQTSIITVFQLTD